MSLGGCFFMQTLVLIDGQNLYHLARNCSHLMRVNGPKGGVITAGARGGDRVIQEGWTLKLT